jgi:hypothetical protein
MQLRRQGYIIQILRIYQNFVFLKRYVTTLCAPSVFIMPLCFCCVIQSLNQLQSIQPVAAEVQ